MSSAAHLLPLRSIAAPASPWLLSRKACLAAALTAAAWHALLLAMFVSHVGGHVSALVCLKADQVGRSPYEAIRIGFGKDGFDGQFYYALARNPWRSWSAPPMDGPSKRHVRILYPALGWLLSGGGDPVKLLWVLPAINLLAIAGLAWLGARWATHHGLSAGWGFLLPIVLNIGMPAMRGLTEPLAALTACGVLTAWLLRGRGWVVFAWAAAAVLSREQNAVIVLIVLLAALSQRRWGQAAATAAALVLLTGWFIVLRCTYGNWPFWSGNFGAPLAGMMDRLARMGEYPARRYRLFHIAGLSLLVVQIALCGTVLFFRVNRSVKLVALAGALLAVVAGPPVYGDEWSFLRLFVWMPMAVWMGSVAAGRRWPVALLAPVAIWPWMVLIPGWLS